MLCCFYLTFEGAFQYVLVTEYTDKVLMGNYVRFLLSYGMIRVIILGDHNGNKSPSICIIEITNDSQQKENHWLCTKTFPDFN